MTSTRRLAALTMPLMAGAALMSSAAIANASPDDDAYLAALRAAGISWQPRTEEALIAQAHLICYQLNSGRTPQQVADDIHASLNAKTLSWLDIGAMVNAAHSTYCPGNACDVPAVCAGK